MNILCVCAQGQNRSRWVASYLANKGYITRYKGADIGAPNPLSEEDLSWADWVVFARDRHQKIIHERFGVQEHEAVLGVTDDPRLVPEGFEHIRNLPGDAFHEQWTFPRLKIAIDRLLDAKTFK